MSRQPENLGELRRSTWSEDCVRAPNCAAGVARKSSAQNGEGRTALPRRARLRRHRDSADRQRASFAPPFHSARAARTGEIAHLARARGIPRSASSRGRRLRDPRQSLPSAVPRVPRTHRRRRRCDADRVAGARAALRGKAGHAGRDHRGHDRRRGPDQGRARRTKSFRRADDSLRPAAARESRDFRHQRAAGPRRENPGGPFQHHAGRRHSD